MTENSKPPVDDSKRGNKFFAIFKKVNIFGYFKKEVTANDQPEKQKNADELLVESLNTKRLPSWRQLKYLPRFLSKKEKNIMRLAVVVLIICLGLLIYFLVANKLIDKPATGGIYTENVVGFPQSVNPLYDLPNEVDRDLVKLIFAGLIKQDNNGELIPDLAKEWFVNETKTEYTFSLRDDVYWTDDEKFTSQDVVFTIGAIQNAAYQSPLRMNWTGIIIEALDENTVRFTLPSAYETFLNNLTVGILPMHLWQEILPENANLAELNIKPVGLGPYKFDSFVKDKQGYIKSYTLIKNDNYHLRAPYIEQITFKCQPTFEAAVDSLKNRNADGLSYLPQNLKASLESRKDLNYYSIALPQYTAIFFNQAKNPILADKAVRQALNLSINKNKIVAEILGSEGVATDGPLLPGMPGCEDNKIEESNIEEAKNLLAKAGWQKKEIKAEENQATSTEEIIENDGNGWSKYLFKNNQELAVQLTTTDQPQSMAARELIQKYWQSIGVRVNLVTVEVTKIQKEAITERNFEALMFGEILGNDLDLYPFWHSSAANNQGLNIANFRNDKADKLLEALRKPTDNNEERAKNLQELQKIFEEEMPAVFLYNPKYTYTVADRIKGINLTRIVSPTDRLNGVTDWYIKTKKGFK